MTELLYVADLQLWLKHMKVTSYADDTKTCASHRLLCVVLKMLEEDAKNVLMFMASNGLVANPNKTAFMILNHKQESASEQINILVGSAKIEAEQSAKLLGVTLDCNQKWKSQIQGVISSLNSRMFLLRRLQRAISKDRLVRIADSIYSSIIRYGVQLYGKVRRTNLDPTDSLMDSLQVAQNKFARFLHGSTLLDKINTKVIFKETNLLSINQINAQIKLLEVWKSKNFDSYPIKWLNRKDEIIRGGLKCSNKPDLIIKGKTSLQSQTFINDAASIWNSAPSTLKECNTLGSVKKQINLFIRTLPI